MTWPGKSQPPETIGDDPAQAFFDSLSTVVDTNTHILNVVGKVTGLSALGAAAIGTLSWLNPELPTLPQIPDGNFGGP